MPSDTVTLRMEGDIPLGEYARVVGQFDDLVGELTHEIAPGVAIDWALEGLAKLPSSAETTAYGRADARDAVHSVAGGYLSVGRALESNAIIPYSAPVKRTAGQMRDVLNGHIKYLVFETAENEATVTASPISQRQVVREIVTKGGIAGRIQTVSNRRGLRFTLYDAVHDRAVSCYLTEGREDVMLDAWGKFAIVEGMVKRNPETGWPTSIRGITAVTVRPEGGAYDFLSARGAVPGPFLMSAEEAVRRIRDAQ